MESYELLSHPVRVLEDHLVPTVPHDLESDIVDLLLNLKGLEISVHPIIVSEVYFHRVLKLIPLQHILHSHFGLQRPFKYGVEAFLPIFVVGRNACQIILPGFFLFSFKLQPSTQHSLHHFFADKEVVHGFRWSDSDIEDFLSYTIPHFIPKR